jgi:hypothetical protein
MRLTIAIPTVNRDYCIRRALDSALAQTSPAIEIIVSNNGSSDRTREILDTYDDPRLRVFHHATTMPVAVHANFLVDQARGELTVALSDDDYLEPEFAGRVLDLFARYPELSFAYTRCYTHIRDAALPSPAGPEVEDTLSFFHNYFAGERHVFWCACVTRTDALRRIVPIPEDVQIGDMYIWTQFAFEGPIGCVPELLAHYTYLVDNVSLGIPVCSWAFETQRISASVADRCRQRGDDARSITALEQKMAMYVARTTANQFALNASRGARKSALMRALWSCGQLLLADVTTAVPRVVASLVLPSRTVKRLVVHFAASRSRWARQSAPSRIPREKS